MKKHEEVKMKRKMQHTDKFSWMEDYVFDNFHMRTKEELLGDIVDLEVQQEKYKERVKEFVKNIRARDRIKNMEYKSILEELEYQLDYQKL